MLYEEIFFLIIFFQPLAKVIGREKKAAFVQECNSVWTDLQKEQSMCGYLIQHTKEGKY